MINALFLESTTLAAPTSSPGPVVTLMLTLQQAFTEDLKHTNSKAFKDLSAKVEVSMGAVFTEEKLPGFVGVRVSGFQPGSTITIVDVLFQPGSKPETGDVIGGVQDALDKGKLDDLGVDKSKKITSNQGIDNV